MSPATGPDGPDFRSTVIAGYVVAGGCLFLGIRDGAPSDSLTLTATLALVCAFSFALALITNPQLLPPIWRLVSLGVLALFVLHLVMVDWDRMTWGGGLRFLPFLAIAVLVKVALSVRKTRTRQERSQDSARR